MRNPTPSALLPDGRYHLFLPVLRIGTASFCLVQCWYWWSNLYDLFGDQGWIQWEISKAAATTWSLHLVDFSEVVAPAGFDKNESVVLFFALYSLLAVAVLLGFCTRVSAGLLWVLHVMILNTLSDFIYGVDIFLHIALFYLVIFPVNRYWSLDARLFGQKAKGISDKTYNRIFQLHLCLVYFSSGLEKALHADWWNGNAIWYTLNHADFTTIHVADTLLHYPWLLQLLGIGTLFTELFYSVVMWIPRWRVLLLAFVVMMHLYIGIALGLRIFSVMMILLSVTAWLSDCVNDYQGFSFKPRIVPQQDPLQWANGRLS
ncbi:HTTM domain-containing protein [Hymenobacter sp. GOD-10R]|uniref:HTTM domain-containing protein n=1 Tax=Hymenobacter sp. GOD-10R TaxID=3093922 RepID=UPI002D76D173|nr:HTTM domain-containing protein [Hymenobacter sp. GOD-10R]WRQ31800.1 HTTM domain-containing protein [Hymenobacter sp. GOD-10R]